MLKLPNVTLVIADTLNYGEAIQSIKKSLLKIEPAASKFLTDIKAYNPRFPFEIVRIDKLEDKAAYSRFMIKDLDNHFDTDFVLVTQHDAWVLDESAWTDEFLEYDYIGAPWLETDGYNVGNGGFSIRSKKLQHILATDEFINPFHPEDATICRLYRPYLEEKYGIKFAPEHLADQFAFELREPNQPTFGFHGHFHKPFRPTVVVKRTGALGDCVAVEPLLEYYHKKDYRVAVDMPIHLALVYAQHHFPVFHVSQIDTGRLNPEVIDLDMAYEENPGQLHLKSYYEKAGIPDGEIKNPKLHFIIGEHNRLFKQYCVLHIDKRDQPYRNIYGVNWREVVQSLNKRGFTVIQVGLSDHEEIEGALYMNTPTTNFLLWLIAGADLFVGIDSGPASIAVATDTPAVIFFGSVDPRVIHPNLSNVCVIEKDKPCNTPKCWSSVVGGTTGKDCEVDKKAPPCTKFSTEEVLYSIDKFLTK